jgi:dihydroorotase (multifunctional complex type)
MKGVLPPPDEGQIYTMFRRIAQLGKRVGIHAENFNIIKTLTELERRSGAQDYEALLRTRPVSCETSIIDTAIDMAKEIGVPLHILHVGVGDGVEHIRRAKADGVDVTAETCSHYLALTNGDAPRCGAVMKTYPLIRTQADQDRVWQGVWDGTIDWVCSDHAPHTWEEKQRGFWDAPAGISGVEALSPVVLTAVNDGKIDIHRAVEITSAAAAKNFGLYPRKGTIREGADADFAIVDMEQEYTFDQKKMYSKAKWTPYDGMRFRGRVVKTILRGGTTMTDGQVTADCRGRYLPVR